MNKKSYLRRVRLPRTPADWLEAVMNFIFFLCGMLAVCCVVLISVYMVVSGVPAIHKIGIFKFLFGTSAPRLLAGIPLFADNILTNATWAWTAIVALSVWQACAFAIILYLAGLQTIPVELYEAASLDGATPWQQFRTITFPMIWAYFTINMVLSLKNSLGAFDQVMALTKGGPDSKTETVSYLIFQNGLGNGEYSYQMANAVTFFIVLAILAFVQLKFFSGKEKV